MAADLTVQEKLYGSTVRNNINCLVRYFSWFLLLQFKVNVLKGRHMTESMLTPAGHLVEYIYLLMVYIYSICSRSHEVH